VCLLSSKFQWFTIYKLRKLGQPAVRAWLREHEIDLGNSDQRPTHWLLVDRLTGRAYVCNVAAARDHVRTQILEEWTG